MTRIAGTIDKWQYLSKWVQDNLKLSFSDFQHLIKLGSIRVNKSLVFGDMYLGPGTNVVTFLKGSNLDPKINHFDPSVWNYKSEFPSWTLVKHVDPDFLLVDKPPGVTTIPSRDSAQGSLVPYWLRRNLPRHLNSSALLTTSRLDLPTHGLIIIGRNSTFVSKHNTRIEQRKITKKYTTVVSGWLQKPARDCVDPDSWESLSHSTNPTSVDLYNIHIPSNHDSNDVVYQNFNKPVWRHVGVWRHWTRSRSIEWNSPPSEKGKIQVLDRNHSNEDLRIISSRIPENPKKDWELRLVIEGVRPAKTDSVALRPFNKAWVQNLITMSQEMGHPLYEIDIELLTGKTHQIRSQLYAEGLSIVGDHLYGSPYTYDTHMIALCCRKLAWEPSISEEKGFSFDLRDIAQHDSL